MNKNVLVYDQPKHQNQLLDWLMQWHMPLQLLTILPTTGLIIEDVGAVFCYETNSPLCFVELLIVNKNTTKEVRDECLDLLISTLKHMMKEKGYTYMASYSKYQTVVDRAVKHGFQINEGSYQCFMRRL